MSRNLGWSPFQATFTDDDVRRLGGPAAFGQGDAWQRTGHVRRPTLLSNGVGAEVVGTWQRADTVTATVAGSRIRTECSCEGGEFCRHAAALLLHWLRSPASFRAGGIAFEDLEDSDFDEEVGGPEDENSPIAEFAGFLAQDTMTHLRQIARARGLQVTARNKAELIEQLAVLLTSAESVHAALMGLDDDARIALAAIDLVNAEEKSTREAVGRAYKALGGAGKMRLHAPVAAETLADLALVIPSDRYAHPPSSYVVPLAVAGPLASWMRREGHLQRLLGLTDGRQDPAAPAEGEHEAARGALTLLELFQVIVHELVGGTIGAHAPAISPTETAFVPPGWRIDPTQSSSTTSSSPQGPRHLQQSVRRLTPLPSPITHADLRHLVKLTGLSTVMIEFAIEILQALGIVDIVIEPNERRVQAHQDLLQTLLSYSPAERLVILSDMYVNMGDSTDLRAVVGLNRSLQLHYRASYYSSVAPFQPQDSAVRHILALLLAWLAEREEERWYDVASLLDLLWNLGPSLLGQSAAHYGEWWFTSREQPETRLNLEVREDWQRVMEPLVTAMLAGPLTWLGLVDTLGDEGKRLLSFRALPASQVLAGEVDDAVAGQPPTETPPLVFDVAPPHGELTVTVPAGSPDPAIHTILSTIGELQQVSAEGLRYRLTVERLQPIFESGIGGPELLNALASRAGGPLPDGVRQTLERWWDSYGSVRLYDDVTLIELGDGVLLRELHATTSLDRALVHTFSPRLIAVDGTMVQELIAELRRLGHTPRVVEGA